MRAAKELGIATVAVYSTADFTLSFANAQKCDQALIYKILNVHVKSLDSTCKQPHYILNIPFRLQIMLTIPFTILMNART